MGTEDIVIGTQQSTEIHTWQIESALNSAIGYFENNQDVTAFYQIGIAMGMIAELNHQIVRQENEWANKQDTFRKTIEALNERIFELEEELEKRGKK